MFKDYNIRFGLLSFLFSYRTYEATWRNVSLKDVDDNDTEVAGEAVVVVAFSSSSCLFLFFSFSSCCCCCWCSSSCLSVFFFSSLLLVDVVGLIEGKGWWLCKDWRLMWEDSCCFS